MSGAIGDEAGEAIWELVTPLPLEWRGNISNIAARWELMSSPSPPFSQGIRVPTEALPHSLPYPSAPAAVAELQRWDQGSLEGALGVCETGEKGWTCSPSSRLGNPSKGHDAWEGTGTSPSPASG